MAEWLPLAATLPFVAVLLLSGLWANRRYRSFERLPAHFDIRGKADAYASRRTMVWMLPTLFSIMLVAIALFTIFLPRELQNGDPVVGVLVVGLALAGAQVFVLRLTESWARGQSSE